LELIQNNLIAKATQLLLQMQNKITWFVCYSEYGVLSLNFGEPHLSIHGPYRSNPSSNAEIKAALGRRLVKPTGDWQLFIESAGWEAVGGPYRASRTSEASERNRALDQLDGQRLLNVRFDQQTARWVLNFDLGVILMIGSAKPGQADDSSERDEDQWTLFFWNAGNATWTLDGRLVFESQQDRPPIAASSGRSRPSSSR